MTTSAAGTPGTPPSRTPRPPWARSRWWAPTCGASRPATSDIGVSNGNVPLDAWVGGASPLGGGSPESPASHSIHATSSVAMALSFAAMRATSTSSKVWPVPSSTAVGAGCAGGARAASTPLRRVINVSGDGPNNTGRMVTLARDETTKRHFEAELHARRKLLIGNVADLLKLYGRGVPCRVGACEADHIRAEVRDRRVRHKGLDAIIMCGSARGEVPAIADAIERKPLWIDIS